MSVWSENPEFFDEWLETEALEGRFGTNLKELARSGNFSGWE